jgi:hypothetical protein
VEIPIATDHGRAKPKVIIRVVRTPEGTAPRNFSQLRTKEQASDHQSGPGEPPG